MALSKIKSTSLETDAGSFNLIESTSGTDLSSISSLDIDLPDTYKSFKLNIHLKPETNNAHVHFRLSSDGGSSFHSASDTYSYAMGMIFNSTDDNIDVEQSGASTYIFLSKGIGNATNNPQAFNATMFFRPIHTESSKKQTNQVSWQGTRVTDTNDTIYTHGTGRLRATDSLKADACRFFFSSGNVEEYFYHLWGEK